MKKKKFIIIPIVIVLIVFLVVFGYYNSQDAKTALTVSEKRWVEENSQKVVDFEVVNNYPLYGMNGEGVFFEFLDDFEKDVQLEFNRIPYLKESTSTTESYRFRILNNEDRLTANDLLLFTDGYIALGKEYQRINHVSDMKNMTFGVFKEDIAEVGYYLKSGTNLAFKSYDTITDLLKALDDGEVSMIIIPNIMYLDQTIGKTEYSINYYFTEMTKKVVLTLSGENTKLNRIVKKYFQKWKEEHYIQEYNTAYLNYYIEANDLTAKEKADLISKNYVYGYVSNTPYEVKDQEGITGIAGEYINRVSRLTDITFQFKEYKTRKALEKAIEKGEVDIYFDHYNFSDEKYLTTLSTFVEDYVVLGKQEDNHIINSLESLKGESIVMLQEDSLYNYFENNARCSITTYENIEQLVKKAEDKVIVLDREIYNNYRDTFLKDYTILYLDTMMNDYKFMVKENNKAFYNLFNYIMSTNSYYNYRNSGLQSIHHHLVEQNSFEQLFFTVLILVFLPLFVIFNIFIYMKHKGKQKKVKKEDRHKYTDMLTSLKNRNYLNQKVAEWEAAKVYPQAIVMVDLNNVKYVNDNYGHEKGDELIVKAASILVNTQLENSEIIRTDGNEFLIYLVGYSEEQIRTYASKLEKEMKELPYEFGAGVGYSMILDAIKTFDDAINEATLEMMTKKQGLTK